MEKDPAIWECTTNRCSSSKENSSAEANLGLLETSIEKICVGGGTDVGFYKGLHDGENAENLKNSKWGSSVESEICEAGDDGNAVSVSHVFERLVGSVSGEGNAEKHVGSLRKSSLTSENDGGLRRLPSSIRNRSKEKGGSSSARGDMDLEKSIIAKLVEVASEFSKERDWATGDVDVFQAAEQAGYTFPRPRWWPPEDEF